MPRHLPLNARAMRLACQAVVSGGPCVAPLTSAMHPVFQPQGLRFPLRCFRPFILTSFLKECQIGITYSMFSMG